MSRDFNILPIQWLHLCLCSQIISFSNNCYATYSVIAVILIPVRIKNCYMNVQLSAGWGVLLKFFKMFLFLLWFINRNEVASLQRHGPAVSSSVWSLVASEDWNCMIAGLFNSVIINNKSSIILEVPATTREVVEIFSYNHCIFLNSRSNARVRFP
jgi:hypothetical protein